ncbi:hypothetical protein KUTeg_022782 [Tegillarca granosa]|uniref:Uncharacterized protein n=1 Tax=Tegillarca granosa TaxID=220873 RepID=A0ABQ9E5A3_TEGGR|nr:hypothetical protein KUTeg_022782 [Tegillarca granosa]
MTRCLLQDKVSHDLLHHLLARAEYPTFKFQNNVYLSFYGSTVLLITFIECQEVSKNLLQMRYWFTPNDGKFSNILLHAALCSNFIKYLIVNK